jgi:hypothetical protein
MRHANALSVHDHFPRCVIPHARRRWPDPTNLRNEPIRAFPINKSPRERTHSNPFSNPPASSPGSITQHASYRRPFPTCVILRPRPDDTRIPNEPKTTFRINKTAPSTNPPQPTHANPTSITQDASYCPPDPPTPPYITGPIRHGTNSLCPSRSECVRRPLATSSTISKICRPTPCTVASPSAISPALMSIFPVIRP